MDNGWLNILQVLVNTFFIFHKLVITGCLLLADLSPIYRKLRNVFVQFDKSRHLQLKANVHIVYKVIKFVNARLLIFYSKNK